MTKIDGRVRRALGIHAELKTLNPVPDEGLRAESNEVIPPALTRNTRGYIEKIANQINGCYERGWFDACAVMIRRLVETLIIEVFENQKLAHKIQDPKTGDFFYLRDLIDLTIKESSWNLGRNTKTALPHLKDIGDKSAHSRRFVAHRQDIEKHKNELRIVIQELIYLAKIK